jgi:lactate dehydrogenase-like 2-hydroxyacid dehydrogenase
MKAFIFDPLWDELVDQPLLNKLHDADIQFEVIKDIRPLSETKSLFEGDEERVLCLNPDYVGWKLQNSDYGDIPNLKAILIASTGFEWVEKETANRLGIPICNIRDFSTQAVAEWALMMMFSLTRQTPRLIKDGFPLDYGDDFMNYRGVQLKGKTAGIIGLGHIGSAIAKACEGIGMKVVYWSRSNDNTEFEYVSLEELMTNSDVVFPTLAKNPETLGLISDSLVESMKPTAILVDIAHGLLNQELALKMIEDNKLFGYGFEGEPKKFSEFKGNIWAAPAYAWTTYESMYNSESKLIDNIIASKDSAFPTRIN